MTLDQILYIISECQIGFIHKARRSYNILILKIIHVIHCTVNTVKPKTVECIYMLHFGKAFDPVIQMGLKIKLRKTGVGTKFYDTYIIKIIHASRKSCVRLYLNLYEYHIIFFQINVGIK